MSVKIAYYPEQCGMSPIRMLLASVTSRPMAPGNSDCPTVHDESPRKDRSRLCVGKQHRTLSIKRNIPYRPRSTVSGIFRKMGSRLATREHEKVECPVNLFFGMSQELI
jgi:hypothetical protein